MTPTTERLGAHARELAAAFDVVLIEDRRVKPEDAFGVNQRRIAVVSPIVDETTYAVALHELGHLLSPTGAVRAVAAGNVRNLMRIEEDAAWTWARHYALDWTPTMDALASWAESTYAPRERPTPPRAPAPIEHIDWSRYR